MSPLETVKDQVAALRRQGRYPAIILCGRRDFEDLWCKEGIGIYVDLWPYSGVDIGWHGPRALPPLVLPADFQGFGQGACRPGAGR